MSTTAYVASINARAALSTASGSPAKVKTDRLWSGSLVRSRSRTPGVAAMTLASPSMTSTRRPSLTFGTHSTMPDIGESVPKLVGLRGPRVANPRGQRLHHRVDDLHVLMEDVLELPGPEDEATARGGRRHGRGPLPPVHKGDLAEEVTRPHRRDLLAAAGDVGRARLEHEEVTAVRALRAEDPARSEIHLFDLGRDEIDLLAIAVREERDGLQSGGTRVGHRSVLRAGLVLAFGVPEPLREHGQQGEGDLGVTLEDPLEVPALDAEAGGRLDRADRRRPRELVEERHLTEHVPLFELRELVLVGAALLDGLDLALLDDEGADARVALAHDVLARGVALLHGRVRDGLE